MIEIFYSDFFVERVDISSSVIPYRGIKIIFARGRGNAPSPCISQCSATIKLPTLQNLKIKIYFSFATIMCILERLNFLHYFWRSCLYRNAQKLNSCSGVGKNLFHSDPRKPVYTKKSRLVSMALMMDTKQIYNLFAANICTFLPDFLPWDRENGPLKTCYFFATHPTAWRPEECYFCTSEMLIWFQDSPRGPKLFFTELNPGFVLDSDSYITFAWSLAFI